MSHRKGAASEFLWLRHISVFVGRDRFAWFGAGKLGESRERRAPEMSWIPKISAKARGKAITFVLYPAHPARTDFQVSFDMYQESPIDVKDLNCKNYGENR